MTDGKVREVIEALEVYIAKTPIASEKGELMRYPDGSPVALTVGQAIVTLGELWHTYTGQSRASVMSDEVGA
jgi:hypothetical protein